MKRRNIPETRRCCNGSKIMRERAPLCNLNFLKEKKKCQNMEKIELNPPVMQNRSIMA